MVTPAGADGLQGYVAAGRRSPDDIAIDALGRLKLSGVPRQWPKGRHQDVIRRCVPSHESAHESARAALLVVIPAVGSQACSLVGRDLLHVLDGLRIVALFVSERTPVRLATSGDGRAEGVLSISAAAATKDALLVPDGRHLRLFLLIARSIVVILPHPPGSRGALCAAPGHRLSCARLASAAGGGTTPGKLR
eukprot:CAMPEP_0197900750 /NCGR_PEP_ID=MMETSP1439-20131203/49809_1 /TAXON_ID=66791 /ORGANISM="Gonyaulax spinifera, Strain CCMP409" /LENGTH=192 /DNA_ID=CAMNT_0043521667 /DNA_START=14 /DNA_END=589 /DNA_ORIENTATION=+